ncbi:flavin-containing monooxygenase [Nocardia seriolae]|nr:NAD(P)/FAD-dependent oxidoreductase [Nocardia seriolae]MTJ66090.1 FAD-dependent oxidoreductase [Nocardia seriolae]MTJ74118.1 FAD-dependent oxidoreductase [Nocardia seriolae]MTJ85993.1 FAD-dependent oxidoreductase [Nocardia seriolae]MTK29987.1 FAD-dependent oxidoreductase [Nocardia seriolae]MTK44085.1 FAD-dependent oxidoreductase [Nocardia seriolae]
MSSPRIAIVGAGISGICMAVALRQAGFTDFTIYEKGADCGGTWRDNTYPGLVCDVPSRYYQFRFAMNPEWTQLYPTGPEIEKYLIGVARQYGLERHTRFGTTVTAAEFTDTGWRVELSDGTTDPVDFVVCATGFLVHPNRPAIAGLDEFGGVVMHSARWDHDVDVTGKRVGIIGTGSTGTQLVSALAGKVPEVVLFQRTPQWILPTVNRPYSRLGRLLYRRIPALGKASYHLNRGFFAVFSQALVHPGRVRQLVQWVVERNLRSVEDPELRRKLTPDYTAMCKRLVVSDRFYKAIQHPDAELVTEGIDHIEERGVVTSDGRLYELDIIVLATGFDSHAYMRPMAITGTAGRTLDQAWADGPRAFEGVMMPDFPNLFMLIGPHSPFANHPITAVAEAQSARIVSWLKRWGRGEFASVAPTRAATDRYNARMRAAAPSTVWTTGCKSWYLGKDGMPELWPWTPNAYEKLIRATPDPVDYELIGQRVAR